MQVLLIFQLRQLRFIRSCLTMDSAKTLVHAFVSSCLDYYNTLLVGAAARSSKCRSTADHRNTQIRPHHTNPAGFALVSGSPEDKIHVKIDRDAGQQVSVGPSTPLSG